MKNLLLIFTLSLLIVTPNRVKANDDLVGSMLGAGLGGYLGSTIGRGQGRDVAIGSGVFLGSVLGKGMFSNRQAREYSQPREYSQYRHYHQEPRIVYVYPERTYYAVQQPANYCREYTRNVIISGRYHQVWGTACLQPDGTWIVVN